ncbi:MAG: hypothetical protein KF778_07115 [Rhodocyclaceae bacterium]|nr:hypothetical protein [Rhodocyclaceae bacterium]MBX3668159.1 hypothetical protein [Rhodocyclaceae bacterium]
MIHFPRKIAARLTIQASIGHPRPVDGRIRLDQRAAHALNNAIARDRADRRRRASASTRRRIDPRRAHDRNAS